MNTEFDGLEKLENQLFLLLNSPDWYTNHSPVALWAKLDAITADYSKEINRFLREYPSLKKAEERFNIKIRIRYALELLNRLLKIVKTYEKTGWYNPERLAGIQDVIKKRQTLIVEYFAPIVEQEEDIFNDIRFREKLEANLERRLPSICL